MKKIAGLLIFILSGTLVQTLHAQTMDEIINKHIEAMGGREKIITLSTAVMTGTFTTAGAPAIHIVASKKHLVGSRIDIDANGINNYQLITTTNGWIFTPVQGDKEPRQLAEDQFRSGQAQLDLHGPFVNYKEKGYQIVLAGKDTVKGSLCNKLKVTAPNGNVTVYSIDSRSNFIVKSTTRLFQFGSLEDVVTTYSDYKKNDDGFWFAYSNTSPRGETRYETIETSKPVDVNIFKIK